jgi:hypothetical protein
MQHADGANAMTTPPLRDDRAIAVRRLGGVAIGTALAGPACAAAAESEFGWVGIAIVAAIVLFLVGLGLRVWRSARMSPDWKAFIERRKAEGRSTTWADWDDDDEKQDREQAPTKR